MEEKEFLEYMLKFCESKLYSNLNIALKERIKELEEKNL